MIDACECAVWLCICVIRGQDSMDVQVMYGGERVCVPGSASPLYTPPTSVISAGVNWHARSKSQSAVNPNLLPNLLHMETSP
jgi:hypothetical protein